MVRFVIELALVFLREMAVIGSHIFLFVVLQTLLAAFQSRSLSGFQLAILDAVGDPILLIGLALIHLIHARMTGINLASARAGSVAVLRLSSCGSENEQAARCQD